MAVKKNYMVIKVLVVITFLVMVIVNALADILPINGVGTGQVSDLYKNLFAPTGYTFIIWGLIYLLLAGYSFYQIKRNVSNSSLLDRIGFYFIISSITNTFWIFAWHYYRILTSMLLMIIILVCLIMIVREISKTKLAPKEKIFIKLPFSIYFGWITVATIANATALLVSLGWNGFGISETVWTVAVIIIGLIIGAAVILKNRDIAYGLVIIWAYAGILVKHVSVSGFDGKYPSITATVIVSIVILLIAELYVFISKKTKKTVRLSRGYKENGDYTAG